MKLQNLIHIVIGIVCVGLLANAEAVNPPPDGGYPEANTAEGQNALFSLTTGVANTAVGWLSLNVLDTGKFNTAIGAATLIGNTADAKYGHWRWCALQHFYRRQQHGQWSIRAF